MRAIGLLALGIVGACASDPPPKPAEPAAPLEIPPLPPPKEPPARPTTRAAPAPTVEPTSEDDGVEPSPMALPCKSDAECATHRCNMRVGKCAFPCKSDRDCIQGATCFIAQGSSPGNNLSVCIPKSP